MDLQMKNTDEEPEVGLFAKPEMTIKPLPDGGWGWVICFAAFMTNFVVIGMTTTTGIIFLGLLDLFNESVAETSLVGSIIAGARMFGGPLVMGLLACKASHRQIMIVGGIIAAASTVATAFAPSIKIMTFTYGILAGLSLAMNYFTANVFLGCYFDKKLALALGIANSGSGLGNFALAYLTERGISFYGMRGTFLLIGGVFLNLVVFGSLCRPLKTIIKSSHISENKLISEDESERVRNPSCTNEDKTTKKNLASSIEDIQPLSKTSCYCDTTIYRNKTFVLLLVIYLLYAVVDSVLIYLPAYAESVGISRRDGAMILSIYGIIATLSQILVGFLADVIHIPTSYLLSSAMLSIALSIVSIPFCQTFTTLTLITVVFSVGCSFGVSLRIVFLTAVLGIEKMSGAYSTMTMLIGVGYIVYPIINGLIYDATHSFPIIFYMNFALTFLGAILSFGVIYAQKNGQFVN